MPKSTTTLQFNTYNPRRNLPPAIGRKRGEANFLGAFERYLLSVVFQCGLSGRNFALSNYGIADLVWFLPGKAAQTEHSCETLYAFETKIENWRRAFQQAYRYSYYSDKAFVVLPPDKSKAAVANLDLFREHGIGLWLFDKKNVAIEEVFTPKKCSARNPDARQKAIGVISSKVKFC